MIDADAIVHELQAKGQPMVAELAAAFGPGSSPPTARSTARRSARSSSATKPRGSGSTRSCTRRSARSSRGGSRRDRSGSPLVVLDIPLLFEGRESGRGSAAARNVQTTVVVWVPESVQIERQIARDGCSRAEAEQRVRAQLPLDRKRELADHVIDNCGLARRHRAPGARARTARPSLAAARFSSATNARGGLDRGVGRARALDPVDERAAHDDAVGERGDPRRVLGGRHAEADADRHVGDCAHRAHLASRASREISARAPVVPVSDTK